AVGEPRRALEPGHIEVRIREQGIAERPASTQRHIALSLEGGGGFVGSAPVALYVVAAAADIAHFERDLPREFTLHTDRELVHVRCDEAGVRERQPAAEECERP